jgi:lipid-binding SYLF domain-containing protein
VKEIAMRKTMIAVVAALPLLASAAPADTDANASHPAASRQERHARSHVEHAASAVQAMLHADPGLVGQVREARAVFVVPAYGRGGLIVGGSGGPGVLMVRHAGGWAGPALFNVGTISVGALAGGEGGSLVMILMTDKAVHRFEQGNNFKLGADAGLTFAHWSKDTQTVTGKPDVVVWDNLTGAYAGASVGATDVRYAARETSALYGHRVTVRDIEQGQVHTAAADPLVNALPAA